MTPTPATTAAATVNAFIKTLSSVIVKINVLSRMVEFFK
jgi:hypothetical protein